MLDMVPRLHIADPPARWSLTLAKKLAAGNPLDEEIVMKLVARPQRYADLRPLLRGKGENNLTQALYRLELDSIVLMRTNFQATPSYDYYELTDLGVDVVMRLAEQHAMDRIAIASHRLASQGRGPR